MPSSSTTPPGDGTRPSGLPHPGFQVPGQSHYDLLQVSPGASALELRQAFRLLSKRYHPDTTTLPQEQAEEAFRRLQQAYAVLIDPANRRRYDALLQGGPAVPASSAGPVPSRPAGPPLASPRPVGVRRSLSGGEWFALLLLAMALVLSLVLGIGVAWARGTALVRPPSWLPATDAMAPPAAGRSAALNSPPPAAADASPAA
jgi:hypothetical protein